MPTSSKMALLLLLFLFTQSTFQSVQSCPYIEGTVDFSGINISTISQSTFETCSSFYGNTTTLILSNCSIFNIDSDSFNRFFDLKTLDLSHNKLEQISVTTFRSLVVLETLDLSFNQLAKLEAGLIDLYALKKVYFQNNNISEVETGIVSDVNENLIYFNLNYNKMTYLDPWPYLVRQTDDRDVDRLFDIQHNYISEITNYQNWTYNLSYPFQVIINAQFNQIQTLDVDLFRKYMPDIEYDSLFAGFLTLYMNMTNNPYVCDCKMYPFAEMVRSGVLRWSRVDEFRYRCNATGIDWLHDIETEELVCSLGNDDMCPSGCYCEDRPHNDTLYIDCKGSNLEEIPDHIPETTRNNIEMFLDNNRIRTLKSTSYIEKLSNLSLSNNQIGSLDSGVLKNMTNMMHLDLSRNSISEVPKEIQRFNYGSVNLAGNPLRCGCDSMWLSEWMNLDKENGDQTLKCDSDAGTHTIISLTLTEMNCTQESLTIMLILIGISIVILVIVFIFAKRCPYETKVILHKLFRIHPRDKYKVDNDKNKDVDIYISFDNNDRDVVGWVKIFINKLNSKKPIYSVLNPCRFTEPNSEAENITKWVAKSKRIIIILSENYFKNRWRSYEADNAEMNLREAEVRKLEDGDVETLADEMTQKATGPAGKIIYIIYNSSPKLKETLEEEPWKSRLANKKVFIPGEKLFYSKVRYELPPKGNGVGDGNFVHKDEVVEDTHNRVVPINRNRHPNHDIRGNVNRERANPKEAGRVNISSRDRNSVQEPIQRDNKPTQGNSNNGNNLLSREPTTITLHIDDETSPKRASKVHGKCSISQLFRSREENQAKVHKSLAKNAKQRTSQVNVQDNYEPANSSSIALNPSQLLNDGRIHMFGASGYSRDLKLCDIISNTVKSNNT